MSCFFFFSIPSVLHRGSFCVLCACLLDVYFFTFGYGMRIYRICRLFYSMMFMQINDVDDDGLPG